MITYLYTMYKDINVKRIFTHISKKLQAEITEKIKNFKVEIEKIVRSK